MHGSVLFSGLFLSVNANYQSVTFFIRFRNLPVILHPVIVGENFTLLVLVLLVN